MERCASTSPQLCAGWDVEQVREIVAETLHDIIDPIVYDEAVSPDRGAPRRRPRRRHRQHVAAPRSSSRSASLLGADRVIATRMVVEDGRYTGEIELLRVRPRTRPSAMRDLADDERLRPRGVLRLQRLRHRRCPCSRRSGTRSRSTPTRRCARSPRERGWPVLIFATPVALQRRFPRMGELPPKRTATAVALAGAATAGLVWYVRRRARLAG